MRAGRLGGGVPVRRRRSGEAGVDMPTPFGTFKQAPKADGSGPKQEELGL